MTDQIVGTYHLLETRPDKIAAGYKVQDKIGAVVAQQVELQGDDKPFKFKAFGLTWRYAPEAPVQKAVSNTGAMIAFYMPNDVALPLNELATDAFNHLATQAADLHLTLVYLAEDATDLATEAPAALLAALNDFAQGQQPVTGEINGVGRFYTSDPNPIYANVDAPALPTFRQQLVALAQQCGIDPVAGHGFTPHITLGWVYSDDPQPEIPFEPMPVTFDRVYVVWGDERSEILLGQGDDMQTKAADRPGFNSRLSVVKQANGIYRWNSISSGNVQDRDGETVRLKALQADVARTEMFGDDSYLYFFHVPYAIGGAPDYRALVDGMLVESGEYYDTPVAKAVAQYAIDHPEGIDSSGWGTSIGFWGAPDLDGSYHSVLIGERSQLPFSRASFAYSQFGVKSKMAISVEQKKALETVLGDPALVGIVMTSVNAGQQSKSADGDGMVRKAAQTPAAAPVIPEVPVFKKAGQYAVTPQDQMGFGKVVEKDAAAIATAAEAEAVASAAADDANDTLMAAMANTDAAVAATIAEARVAAVTPDPAMPAAPVEKAKAGLTDEDLQGIAQYVADVVQKSVADLRTELLSEVGKVQKAFSIEAQAKLMNEVPRTAFERLKSFGATPAAGQPKTITGFVNGIPQQVSNPAYVEKGQNLPTAPDDPVSNLISYLGFDPSAQQ